MFVFDKHFKRSEWVVFLAVCLLYTLTLAPNVLPADAGEYQVVGAVLGVAHPPGFALYTLISWFSTRLLFWLAPATAINALSAVLAAGTVTLIFSATRRLSDSVWCGVVAAGALAWATTFWAQATYANVRILAAFAIAWAVWLLPRKDDKALSGWFALALGLGVAHHASTVFMAAGLGLYALWRVPSTLKRWWTLWPGLLPFLTWLYFPLRADAFGAPDHIATWNGFLEHILARGFAGDMFHFATLAALPDRLLILGNILLFQWHPALLVLAAIGAGLLLWRERALGVALVGVTVLHAFIAITYRAPQTTEYLLPAYGVMALLMGYGVAAFNRLPKPVWLILTAFPLLWQFRATAPSYLELAGDSSTRAYVQNVFDNAPPNAVVLASWHWATPLWYAQHVEHQRPDVEVRYVYPRGASLAQAWVDEIAATLPQRPVMVTSFFAEDYAATAWRFVPLGDAWQVQAAPLTTAPLALRDPRPLGEWQFLGYHLTDTDSFAANTPLALSAAWSTASPRDINFFVQLIGPDGQLYGQEDVSVPGTRYVSGEVLLHHYTLFPRPDAPPGVYQLLAGAYTPDGLRVAEAPLTQIAFGLHSAPPPTTDRAWAGNAMRLLRAGLPTDSIRPGQTIHIDLHWEALRPIVNDYTIKVDVIGPNWQWRAQSDATPAGGAIPTLKWITGSQIWDRHTLHIPPDAAPGPAQVVLAVYDAFTQRTLPIFDPPSFASGTTFMLGEITITSP